MRSLFKKLVDGVIYGTGFVLFYGFLGGIGMLIFSDVSLYQVKNKLSQTGVISAPPAQTPDEFATTVLKQFLAPSEPIPSGYKVIRVPQDKATLGEALSQAEKNGGNTAIILDTGEYLAEKTLYIREPGIHITSATGNPYDVRIKSRGMFAGGQEGNIFRVSADNFTLDGITLSDAPNHLIQIAGEEKASNVVINNMILEDAYEQFVKISYDRKSRVNNFSVNGRISHSIFQYTRGIAPNYYTGGIDGIGCKKWVVRDNVFRDIASPSEYISQYAVHFWINAEDNVVKHNLFIDNDRSIGFGMAFDKKNDPLIEFSSRGGEIADNVIFHSNNGDPFGDAGIVLESSEKTQIRGNTVFMEHGYPRAIEYRFELTQDVVIANNVVNRTIASRDGGTGKLSNNNENLDKSEFLDSFNGIMVRLGIDDLKAPIHELNKKRNNNE